MSADQHDPLVNHDPDNDMADDTVDDIVDALVAQVVDAALDDPPPPPPPTADELKDLHARAVDAAQRAVACVEEDEAREAAAMGRRLRAEQDVLYARIMRDLRGAVEEAAAAGQRVATVLRFGGADRLDEFCYLYMLKGPVKAEQRAEMRAMGASPLLPRLRRELGAAGFGVFHTWQRATNENTLSVSW